LCLAGSSSIAIRDGLGMTVWVISRSLCGKSGGAGAAELQAPFFRPAKYSR
jgi:hypothetical protein